VQAPSNGCSGEFGMTGGADFFNRQDAKAQSSDTNFTN
jgi:hypothetical protein